MLNEHINQIYPCLNEEKLSYEVENGEFYSNIVTYFESILEHNIFYHGVHDSPRLLDMYLSAEKKYIDMFYYLYSLYTIYSIELSTNKPISQFRDFIELEKVCYAGLREEKAFCFLIPELKVMILSSFDLKLVVFWKKEYKIPKKLKVLIEKLGIQYE